MAASSWQLAPKADGLPENSRSSRNPAGNPQPSAPLSFAPKPPPSPPSLSRSPISVNHNSTIVIPPAGKNPHVLNSSSYSPAFGSIIVHVSAVLPIFPTRPPPHGYNHQRRSILPRLRQPSPKNSSK